MKEYTKIISNWVSTNKYDDIPKDVVDIMKMIILDSIGCAIHGTTLPTVQKVIKAFADKYEFPNSSIIWGTDKRARPDLATFINGTAVQSDELDQAGQHTHASASNMTAVLACADVNECVSGKEFINSLVVGEEILARLGACFTDRGYVFQDIGLHQAAVLSPAGTVAALSQAYKLNNEQVYNAFGIGLDRSFALEITRVSSEYKRCMQAHGGMIGLQSVLLAKEGLTGVENVFETDGGFMQFFTQSKDKFNLDDLVDSLGKKWLTLEAEMKRYMGMMYQHPHYHCAKLLSKEYKIDPNEIEKIDIDVNAVEYNHSNVVYNRTDSKTFAQFCIPYGVAAMFLEGNVFIDQYKEEKLKNPIFVNLAQKIFMHVNTEWPRDLNSGSRPSKITVLLKNGDQFSKFIEYGYKTYPLTREEVIQKFKKLSSDVFNENKISQIIDLVFNIEKVTDVKNLTKLLQK